MCYSVSYTMMAILEQCSGFLEIKIEKFFFHPFANFLCLENFTAHNSITIEIFHNKYDRENHRDIMRQVTWWKVPR